jgi:thiosulfate reductase cytochrome b subunit
LCYAPGVSATAAVPVRKKTVRHAALVRVTHWLTAVAFLVLLFTGCEIILTHPRFYWGETGNVTMKPLFKIPVPSSRDTVPTGYNFVLPDWNGWGRALHFEAAWLLVFTALVYGVWGLWTGHFRRNLLPERGDWSWRAFWRDLWRSPRDKTGAATYNVVQRVAYFGVIFFLFPMVIWTGLALSPTFNAAFPWFVDVLGGRQSARTLHFFITIALTLFLVVHVTMVAMSGFRAKMRGMITGHGVESGDEEQP